MSALFLLNKIRQTFPQIKQNINLINIQNNQHFQLYLNQLASQIPNLSPHYLHQICQNQQKSVFHKIRQIKSLDLYDQIAMINPSLNFKTLTIQQISKKISYLKPEPMSQRYTMEQQNQIQDFDFDYNDKQDHEEVQHELKNILQQQDHHNGWWNDCKIFEFN